MDLRRVFDCMISVSELGRGQASKVIQAVEDEGNPYIVVKNNKPQAVIISINEYTELMRSRDLLNSMNSVQNPFFDISPSNIASNHFAPNHYSANHFSPPKTGALTEDEISIFLQNEEND